MPEDHHIVLAVLGGYAGAYVLYKLTRGSKRVDDEADAHAKPVSAGDSSIPSILSPQFEKFSQSPANVAKWEKSIGEWEKKMENPSYAAAYQKSLA